MNYLIKRIETEDKLKEVFRFFSKVFYEESKEYNEHYYLMGDRYTEMLETFKSHKEFLLYVVDEKESIIGCAIGKNIDLEKSSMVLSVIAVYKEYRNKGIAKALIEEIESECKRQGIKKITLGARLRACPLYLKCNYKPSLMIQVYDFATTHDIRNNNKYNLTEKESYQSDTYGFIIYNIDEVDEKYVSHFMNSVPTATVEYIFEKEL